MSFFDVPDPEPEPEEVEYDPPVWAGPPHGVLPASSTQRAVLARTDEAVLVVDRFRVFTTGVVFTLTLMRKRRTDDYGHPPFEMFRQRPGGSVSDDFVRFGILFADGSKWMNIADRAPDRDGQVEGPVVHSRGGSGGGGLWEADYWLWPLPPAGTLTFVASWPAQGIVEQTAEIDADELIELATQAEQIWPTA